MMDSKQEKPFSDHTSISSGIILPKEEEEKNEWELQMQVDCIQHHDSAIMF